MMQRRRAAGVTADQVADFTKVTAIKIVLNKGEKIVPGEVVNFQVEMKTPDLF